MAGKVMICATCDAAPDNCKSCWLELLSASSATTSVPVRVPLAMGANATAIKHCSEEGSCVPEVQSVPPEGIWAKFCAISTFETFNGWLPALETVRVCGTVTDPTNVVPKVSAAGWFRLTS